MGRSEGRHKNLVCYLDHPGVGVGGRHRTSINDPKWAVSVYLIDLSVLD
jgi:hypothetical protein